MTLDGANEILFKLSFEEIKLSGNGNTRENITMSNTSWSYGWTLYKTGRTGRLPPDVDPADLIDWMKGFCAAMADYDLDGRHPSIQAALLHKGIDGDLLEECLQAAETILNEAAFNRWPSVPVRGFGSSNLRMGPFVVALPDAANDETME